MAWVVLVFSGIMEAGWALSLKASDGFTRLWPTVAFFVLIIASMAGLMFALKTFRWDRRTPSGWGSARC